ncbi:UvrD-helicase domain-containing protein [Methanosarcina mazei]|uniref:UvrD-helicase domain-containing protein n=1 Tax=Methanosarcina mazei TaxID=2209 RepID=UPI003C77D8FD
MIKDPSQDIAINYPVELSLFVTAPPGYGKTYVMIKRVEYLISRECITPPRKLLALTFSNAAADEMKKRLIKNIPYVEKYVDVMTFHTFAYKLLRCYGNNIGISRFFTILDESKKKEYKYTYYRTHFKECSSKWKREDDFVSEYNNWYTKKFLQSKSYIDIDNETIFENLRNLMNEDLINKENLDFDHLLFKAIDLLQQNEYVKSLFFDKYPILLADEFQDTNYIQYKLFREIGIDSKGTKKIVYVMGDKKQAIMRFQGANPDNIAFLIQDFNCKIHELKKNHRTDSEYILHITKKLRDPSLFVLEAKHEMYIHSTVEQEMKRLIELILRLLQNGANPHNICILFPQKRTSNCIKKVFEENSIEYIDISDFKIDSITEEYSVLIQGIRKQIEEKCTKKSVKRIIDELIDENYSSESKNTIQLTTIRKFSSSFDRGHFSSIEVWKRLQEFYNCIQMEIDWVQLVKSNVRNKVYLSTIHGSKGLEFDYIFMIGMVNFKMPHSTSCFPCSNYQNPQQVDISESKDLFYVGVSRAIKEIIFFYSRQDEQNLATKSRKISCVFKDIVECLQFIDTENKVYDYRDLRINSLLCQSNFDSI